MCGGGEEEARVQFIQENFNKESEKPKEGDTRPLVKIEEEEEKQPFIIMVAELQVNSVLQLISRFYIL